MKNLCRSVLVVSLFVAASTVLAQTSDSTDPCFSYRFCGSLTQVFANQPSQPTSGLSWAVNICDGPNAAYANCSNGTLTCPQNGGSCVYTAGGLVTGCTYPEQQWWLSAYKTDSTWGQSYKPIYTFYSRPDCPTKLVTVGVPPRPNVPNVITPYSGQLVTTTAVHVTFANAIDAERDSPNWPVSYTVRTKYWANGTTEPGDSAYQTLYTGACVPYGGASTCDAGTMSTSVVGNYRVRVDVQMNVSSTNFNSVSPVYYTNASSVPFSVPGGRCLGCRF